VTTRDPLDGFVIVITGAARGIGEAAARAIAAQGGSLVLIDVDEHALSRVADAIGPRVALARAADVRSRPDLHAVADDLRSRALGVDVLINNAAVYAQGPLLALPQPELERCLDVNTLGLVAACHAFVPLMHGRPRPHVMNVLSEFAWLPFPNKASYCISKAAAAMASSCLRAELRPLGIRVTQFVPPAVDTGLVASASAVSPDLLAREVDVLRAHAWPADAVGRRIAAAVRRPRAFAACGVLTRAAITAARCFPLTTARLAALAARRMQLS
jgi:short-subunit dehydrogenase